MIPVSNGEIILITGVNGYIGSVLGMLVLSKGYSLRGTSRAKSSTQPLLEGPYAPYIDRVEIYEVPDITVNGAFDDAVKGEALSAISKVHSDIYSWCPRHLSYCLACGFQPANLGNGSRTCDQRQCNAL